MHKLQIGLESLVHRPGDELRGQCSWELERPVKMIAVRLFWHTKGKGTQDIGIVSTQQFAAPALHGARPFTFRLPEGPCSFSGTLITLLWAVEIVTVPGDEGEYVDFVLSPTGKELQVAAVS